MTRLKELARSFMMGKIKETEFRSACVAAIIRLSDDDCYTLATHLTSGRPPSEQGV